MSYKDEKHQSNQERVSLQGRVAECSTIIFVDSCDECVVVVV